jgi:hypothetical protein
MVRVLEENAGVWAGLILVIYMKWEVARLGWTDKDLFWVELHLLAWQLGKNTLGLIFFPIYIPVLSQYGFAD